MPRARANIIAKFIAQIETGTKLVDQDQRAGRGDQPGQGQDEREAGGDQGAEGEHQDRPG